ncbi:sugar O-acyltransferase (sialic acid O-acetyltransferase NeuD family) [Salirhabdus euzebyi]|uniref:Sugar O-acyltransferase (Sialic acid O-acetyltransferase NeuD family) n=1 Tax=Salirhabdus euzebyi TaxID=394506 RepID=A0A841Q822_9BACI|nr:acetyltransferase [Salirhabdus euzebyi]MBB6454546.1 sugar O-acyltransferase (sialic acid O-acetyltransferase NeuD family) [Salirhabdus euzebyi]
MYDIVIVGAGGFGREVYQYAKSIYPSVEYRIKGFLSNNPGDLDGFDVDSIILGDENSYEIQENDRFIFAIGNIQIKKRIIPILKEKGAKFLTLIHPTAVVFDTAKIGEGVVIGPFVTVSDHVEIADFVMMNFYSSVGHDSKVGKYSILSPYATVNGFSTLEEEVFLGTHSTVTAYKTIGRETQISANSVAMYNTKPYSLVYGVPGKIKKIFG